jgi:hypothetical protein
MTTSQLLAIIRGLLYDLIQPYLWTDDELVRFINNALVEACIRGRLLHDDASTLPSICSINYAANQSNVSYSENILVIQSGRIVGMPHKVWRMNTASLDRAEPWWEDETNQPGTPRIMVMDMGQKNLRLYPTPAVAGTLQLRVWRVPLDSELVTVPTVAGMNGATVTSDPVIPFNLPDPEDLKHWAAHEAYLKKDSDAFDADASARHLQIFTDRFGDRPTLEEMDRWADSPPRVRRTVMY